MLSKPIEGMLSWVRFYGVQLGRGRWNYSGGRRNKGLIRKRIAVSCKGGRTG